MLYFLCDVLSIRSNVQICSWDEFFNLQITYPQVATASSSYTQKPLLLFFSSGEASGGSEQEKRRAKQTLHPSEREAANEEIH